MHLNGACSGGIIAAGALGHLAAEGRLGEVASLTPDGRRARQRARRDRRRARRTASIAAAAVAESARRGYLDGQALAGVFTWLRPNDLVWNYVVNNYLLGKEPPAFDVLYWNQDTVRLAAGLHRDFIRIGLENSLVEPGALEVLGTPVDLGAVDVDSYVVAGLTDHIIPWENAYRSTQLLGGDAALRPLDQRPHPGARQPARRPSRVRATASPGRTRPTPRRGPAPPPRCRAAGGPTTTPGSPPARARSSPLPSASAAAGSRRSPRLPAATSTPR